MSTLADLQSLVVNFAERRGWNKEPKDLAMSVAIEAAEVMEHYQWAVTGERLPGQQVDEVALECADVLWYLLRLADAEGIDLDAAIRRKAAINEGRFPPKAAG